MCEHKLGDRPHHTWPAAREVVASEEAARAQLVPPAGQVLTHPIIVVARVDVDVIERAVVHLRGRGERIVAHDHRAAGEAAHRLDHALIYLLKRAVIDSTVLVVLALLPLLAAIAAWMIGKISLGLRSDYLAIATIGVSEIIIFTIKNEDWLARGVKNVIGLPRPVPYEIDLQQNTNFIYWSQYLGMDVVDASSIFVKLCYSLLFILVLIILYWLCEKALKSPWGRMMRAIRDNEVAAEAMGKDVKSRHLQVFILGSAVCGIAGAMLVTLDGQLTPTNYHPLRFTFIIWVMVILGGAGNNLGSILGGFIIWFFWVEVEYIGLFLMDILTSGFADDNAFRIHMLNSAAYMRYLTLGLILVLVLRFNPRGLIPEK